MRLFGNWTNFVLIIVSSFWLSLARGCVTPIVPLYMNSIHLSTIEVGASFSVWGFGTLFFEPLTGLFADRGRRKLLTAALVALVAVFYLLFPRTSTLLGVAALQFLLGAMFAGTAVLYRYTIPDAAPDMPVSKAYGLFGASYFGAAVAGSVIGGLLASTFGFAGAFYAGSFLSIVSLLTLAFVRFPSPPGKAKTADGDKTLPAIDRWWLVLLAAVAALAFITITIYLSLIPLVVVASPYSASVLEVSLLVATFNLSTLIFYPVMGAVGASNPVRWILVGLLLGAFAFGVPLLAPNVVFIFVSAFIGGLSYSMLSPLSLALFVGLVPRARRGLAIGIYGAAEDVGIIIGPAVFSVAMVGFGVSTAFLVIMATNLGGLALLAAKRPGLSAASGARPN